MSKVKVYQFTLYDITSDGNCKSRRWGTLEGINSVGGVALKETATEIDAAEIGSEISGLTERNFSPRKHNRGFQSSIEQS